MRWLGLGSALPERTLTSEELERRQGWLPGAIARRTGVLSRHVAREGEATSDLAVRAAQEALSGQDRTRVRWLLLATSTPDYPLPPTAPAVAARLGLERAAAIDLAGACAGFLYGLVLACAVLELDPDPDATALLIGANVLSRRLDWSDLATAALFGDGAGALLLGKSREPGGGLLAWALESDGQAQGRVWVPAGGSREPFGPETALLGRHRMRMERGPMLFREAIEAFLRLSRRVLERAGVRPEEVTYFVPHQASLRVIQAVARELGFGPDRVLENVTRVGNTSAASIPILLAEAHRAGRLQPGQTLLLAAVGSGLLAGAVLWRL
nr:MAG: 3-oxoacyl-ACP synthase [Bacteroidota bacterium]